MYKLSSLNLLETVEKSHTSNVADDINAPTTFTLSDGKTVIDFEISRSFLDYYCHKFNFKKYDINHIRERRTNNWITSIYIADHLVGKSTSKNKKSSTQLAYIDSLIFLDKCDNRLFNDFKLNANSTNKHDCPPVNIRFSNKVQYDINEISNYIKLSKLFKSNQQINDKLPSPLLPTSNKNRFISRKPPSEKFLNSKSRILKKDLNFYNNNQQYDKIRQQRYSLPIFTQSSQVVDNVNNNQVTVLMAATGSGKTTQVPQIILDDAINNDQGSKCNILCTQPRRIAAISVAQRVASERGEKIGKRVGYQVRFESKKPEPHGSITFCTTGVFLRRMQSALDERENHINNNDNESNDLGGHGLLDDVTHIIVDEVHERDVDTDLTLVVLKRLIADRQSRNKPLKVILMSATIESKLFENYFKDVNNGLPAPVANIPGRSYPVTKHLLDDYLFDLQKLPHNIGGWVFNEKVVQDYLKFEFKNDYFGDEVEIPYPLLTLIIAHVLNSSKNDDGHVLVFLPGWDEIKSVQNLLENNSLNFLNLNFNDKSKFSIHVLHSSVPVSEQQKIFEPCKKGIRRIILSTNVAETSVTIPDVVYVVDAGRVKEKRYDSKKHMSQLVSAWVGKSNLNQRAGRAGRHRSGDYYGLVNKRRYESLEPHQTVEIKRIDLSEVVLRVKALNFPGLEVEDVLEQTIEPPESERVNHALERLYNIGSINENKELTSLGRVLLQLPIEAPIGKLILYATFLRCLDPALTIAAILTNRDPFVAPLDQRSEANAVKLSWSNEKYKSDAFAILNAYQAWFSLYNEGKYSEAYEFTSKNYLSRSTLLQIKQVKEHLFNSLKQLKLFEFLTHSNEINNLNYENPVRKLRKNEILIPDYLNVNSTSMPTLTALIAMSSSPNFALRLNERNYRTKSEKVALVHTSSITNQKHEKSNVKYDKVKGLINRHIISFQEKTTNISNQSAPSAQIQAVPMLRMCTKLDILIYALFGASELEQSGSKLICDDWLLINGRE